MNNNDNKKSGHELPAILRGGTVFRQLAQPVKAEHQQYVAKYRKMVFAKLDEVLPDADKASTSTYKKWFFDPEKRLNEAFLQRERKDPERWKRLTTAMEYVLSSVVAEALRESRELSKLYDERAISMSKVLFDYATKEE